MDKSIDFFREKCCNNKCAKSYFTKKMQSFRWMDECYYISPEQRISLKPGIDVKHILEEHTYFFYYARILRKESRATASLI